MSERTELEAAYPEFRPLLLTAAARLVREGSISTVLEASDLVHDFFIERWASVVTNYRPEQGALRPYVYAAFMRFARRQSLRRSLARGPSSIFGDISAEGTDRGTDDTSAESQVDLAAVAAAIERLPEAERRAVVEYVQTGSIRKAAVAGGVGRYQAHTLVAQAIARIALAMATPAGVDEAEWDVTRAILSNRGGVAEAARHLGLPVDRCRQVHRANLALLMGRLTQVVTLRDMRPQPSGDPEPGSE